jgi:hypothetical protein
MIELLFEREERSLACPWITPLTYLAAKEKGKGEEEEEEEELVYVEDLLDLSYYQEWGSKALVEIPAPFKPPEKLKVLYQVICV